MHTLIVKTLPAQALSSASESFAIELPIISKHIVLAGYIKHPIGLDALENLRRRIELFSARQMRDVASVNHKRRRILECIDLVDRLLQSLCNFMIRILIEPDMTVADLDEVKARLALRSQDQFTRAK